LSFSVAYIAKYVKHVNIVNITSFLTKVQQQERIMGEAAEMRLDGTLCASCGEYIEHGEPGGFPRYCSPECEDGEDNSYDDLYSDEAFEEMIKECLYERVKYDFARGYISHRNLGQELISLDKTAQSILKEAKEWQETENLDNKCQK
jgi:hypothetical protein